MARQLTKKRRGFVNDYADSGNGTQAALKNYDTNNPRVAEAIGSELLSLPIIQEELKNLGFDTNNAKRVVGQILNDEKAKHQDRLTAADKVFKVNSDYAPEKIINVNVEPEMSQEDKELLKLINEYERNSRGKTV